MHDSDGARQRIQAEVDRLSNCGKGDSVPSSLLKLSLAETFVEQGQHDRAESLYLELYVAVSDLTRFGKLRLAMGLAWITHLQSEWADA